MSIREKYGQRNINEVIKISSISKQLCRCAVKIFPYNKSSILYKNFFFKSFSNFLRMIHPKYD